MQVEMIHEWQLAEDDEQAIAVLLNRAFGEFFEGRSFHQQRHHIRLIARDPEIIGHMALCYRAIRMGDALVNIMGLAEVATDPEHRGKGIASALMRQAIEVAQDSQADFFVLYGVRPIYAGVGFRSVSNPILCTPFDHARTGAIVRETEEDLMVMELSDIRWDDTAEIDLLGFKF